MEYDQYGRQRFLHDPDAGTTEYMYNAYGELEYQIDAIGNRYDFVYDLLGRPVIKTDDEGGETSYTYKTTGGGIGLPSVITASNGFSQTFEYDQLGRTKIMTEKIMGDDFKTEYSYDNFSNLSGIKYPSDFTTTQTFNDQGYLTHVRNGAGTVVWEAQQRDAMGRNIQYSYGNGNVTKKTYTVYDMPELINSEPVFYRNNTWIDERGVLFSRQDIINGAKTEEFIHDILGRLKRNETENISTDIDYSGNGNISSKMISTYGWNGIPIGWSPHIFSYEADQPHAVSKVNQLEGIISEEEQNITYTKFTKTNTITEDNYELAYWYGTDNQRRHSVLNYQGNPVRSVTYSGNYEKIEVGGETYHVSYIYGGSGMAAINVRHNGTDELYYVYTDHLGSILLLTDAAGNKIYEQNFDPWGRERNPNDWTYTPNPNTKPPWLIRGFTGHEHLPEFALINMNGRMYDPLLGRMLSPDNYIQFPNNTQGYNRYTYALNDPLKYTDPSGEFVPVVFFGTMAVSALIIGDQMDRAVASSGDTYTSGCWFSNGIGKT